jgi:hypothetical protein
MGERERVVNRIQREIDRLGQKTRIFQKAVQESSLVGLSEVLTRGTYEAAKNSLLAGKLSTVKEVLTREEGSARGTLQSFLSSTEEDLLLRYPGKYTSCSIMSNVASQSEHEALIEFRQILKQVVEILEMLNL